MGGAGAWLRAAGVRARSVGVLAVGLAGGAGTLPAQTPSRAAPDGHPDPAVLRSEAARTPTAPTVDGRLEEPLWRGALPMSGFVQREPHEGEPGTERTEVRVLFDRSADAFVFVLDTFHDGQNAFVFGTNPAGIEFDGQVTREAGTAIGGGQRQQRQESGSGSGFNERPVRLAERGRHGTVPGVQRH